MAKKQKLEHKVADEPDAEEVLEGEIVDDGKQSALPALRKPSYEPKPNPIAYAITERLRNYVSSRVDRSDPIYLGLKKVCGALMNEPSNDMYRTSLDAVIAEVAANVNKALDKK